MAAVEEVLISLVSFHIHACVLFRSHAQNYSCLILLYPKFATGLIFIDLVHADVIAFSGN